MSSDSIVGFWAQILLCKNIENSEVNTLKFVYDHSSLNSMKYGTKYSRKLIDPSPI